MNPEPELVPQASRFLSLAKSIAEHVHEEVAQHLPLEQITSWAISGLNDSFSQYRTRQGATLRTYLMYHIRAVIYSHLAQSNWPSADARNRYRFAMKSNELLLHFTTSAEGATKRSTRAQEEETMHLLRLLVVAGLLIWKEVPRGEIQKDWEQALAALDEKQKRFVHSYYDQDTSLEEAAGLTEREAFRFHLKILETLESHLKHV